MASLKVDAQQEGDIVSGMEKRPRILVLVVALLAGLALLVIWVIDLGKPAAFPPLPEPNGYDDFVKAGSLLGNDAGEAADMDLPSLRGFIEANRESVRLFELGLSRECSVHTAEVVTNMTNVSGWMGDLTSIKKLAQLVAAQGRLAELEQRTNDAIQVYANGIVYGCRVSRGGLLIHDLVGIACQAIARAGFERLLPEVSCEHAQPLIAALERVDRESPSWDEIMKTERALTRRVISENVFRLGWIPELWSSRASVRKARLRHNVGVAHRRLLLTELSLRCAFKETGQVPHSLEDLSPRYLDDLPIDPFGNIPLKYRPAGTNWLLYSVGPDGRDDGGARLTGTVTDPKTRGDIFLDMP